VVATFTGLVADLGAVLGAEHSGDGVRLRIGTPLAAEVDDGDSVAVNGVCLTAVDVRPGEFTADVMRETLQRSSLGALRVGDPVNLERPVTLAGRLGGHLVQGHVDGVGTILAREPSENWEIVRVSLPPDLGRYIVTKGSISVDGVSLTVVSVTDDAFSVSLIPTTLALTTLGTKHVGDPVNLEVDVIAKYVEKLLAGRSGESGAR
jgi:riboflavin synthase